jgi:hypothetical protein
MAKWRTPSLTKQNLGFITKHSLKTSLEEITPSDVVRLVRSFIGTELYSTDIESIEHVTGGYLIRIHPECPIYCGQFKIKYRKYIT